LLVPPEPLADDPDRLAEAVAMAYMEFGSSEWFDNVEMINPETGETEN
jgi:hypothetical protein